MSQEVSERLKGLYPKVKLYNASDRVQRFSFNSHAYVFPPGRSTEIVGQDMAEKDVFGRNLESGRSVPNPHATTEVIADFLLQEGRDRGICLLRNDSTDKAEVEEAHKRFVKATTKEAKAIEARWLQRVLDAKSMGQVPPPMPDYVEQAQDFLMKNRGGASGTHKRFIVDFDGRSFNTKQEAKRHIHARYPNRSADWEKHVEDTDALADPDPETAPSKETVEEAK